MKKHYYIIILTGLGALCYLQACKKFDNALIDPNSPAPESADVDLYLNAAQISFKNFYGSTGVEPGLSENGEELTRMEYMASRRYIDLYTPESFNTVWNEAYRGVFQQVNTLIPLALTKNRPLHVGMACVLKAYTAATLVDFFGDVPYSEANLGLENTNPKADQGRAIYDNVFNLLDSAINNFNKVTSSTPLPINDLFYSNATVTDKASSWRRAAKTLKLKLLLQTRLVDNTVKEKINALITDGELISTDAQAFTFKFGTKAINPNSRSDKFNTYYTSSGANDYIGNYFVYTVFSDKGDNVDPRWRFYFYRQIGNVTLVPVSSLSCQNETAPPHYLNAVPAVPFCYANVAGFYGRDHGDDQGIPPDGFQRLAWGVYPAGGKFDNSERVKVGVNDGGQGAGVLPIWQPAFTDFARAEAALTLGTDGDAKLLLKSGIEKSMATVFGFGATINAPVDATRLQAAKDAVLPYLNIVLARYDAASTNADKLDIIMKEYYVALWGNGIESYNNYRRTGMPRGMQPNRNPAAGAFMRSMPYPGAYTNRNSDVVQKTTTNVKVFWDNNPDNIYVN